MSVEKICSPLKIHSFEYEWTIEKFGVQVRLYPGHPKIPEGARVVKSPFFYVDDNHTEWHLGWYDCKYFSQKAYGLGLSPEFHGEVQYPKKRMEIQYTISYDNKNMKEDVGRKTFYEKINYPIDLHRVLAESLDDIENSHDNITVTCHFHIVDDSFMAIINNPVSGMIKRNLINDIVEHFNNKKFTDIIFILGDKKIHAHKLILMARSPVFAAMFLHSMKEQNDNEVYIDDIDYEVFEEMLRYIYTDDVSNLKCPSKLLLYAAEKYGLEYLKEMCGVLLHKEIAIDNAAETIIIVDRYNLTQLLEQILHFIRSNIENFLNSPGYWYMVEKYPKLAMNVFKLPEPDA